MPPAAVIAIDPRPSHLSTAFYAVKCAPGFQCVSKLSRFPLGHDGAYHSGTPALEPDDPDRFRDWLRTYEAGCPARGKISRAGKCKDNGQPIEEQGFCYSSAGYEGGPGMPCSNPEDCLCVKAQPSDGSQSLAYRNIENEDGKELLLGRYQVQQEHKCDVCQQLGQDQSLCQQCPDCVYKEKSFAGEKKMGCWDKDAGKARRERMNGTVFREFLNGGSTYRKEMIMVPHYKMWNPKEQLETTAEEGSKEEIQEIRRADNSTPRLPYQILREPLSRDKWIEEYDDAVDNIQNLVDKDVTNLVQWVQKAKRLKCLKPTGREPGVDIPGFVQKVLSDMRGCQAMQDIARRLDLGRGTKTLECHQKYATETDPTALTLFAKSRKCAAQWDKDRDREDKTLVTSAAPIALSPPAMPRRGRRRPDFHAFLSTS